MTSEDMTVKIKVINCLLREGFTVVTGGFPIENEREESGVS